MPKDLISADHTSGLECMISDDNPPWLSGGCNGGRRWRGGCRRCGGGRVSALRVDLVLRVEHDLGLGEEVTDAPDKVKIKKRLKLILFFYIMG